jgi:hypothetical protein
MRRRDGETTSPLQKTNMLHLTSRRLRRIIAYASAEATSGSISTWLSKEPISPAEEQSVDAPGSPEFLVPRLLATEAASGGDADDPTAPSMLELLRRLQGGDAFSRKVIRNSQSPKGQRHNLDAGWRVDQKRLVRKVDAIYVPHDPAVKRELLRIWRAPRRREDSCCFATEPGIAGRR